MSQAGRFWQNTGQDTSKLVNRRRDNQDRIEFRDTDRCYELNQRYCWKTGYRQLVDGANSRKELLGTFVFDSGAEGIQHRCQGRGEQSPLAQILREQRTVPFSTDAEGVENSPLQHSCRGCREEPPLAQMPKVQRAVPTSTDAEGAENSPFQHRCRGSGEQSSLAQMLRMQRTVPSSILQLLVISDL